MKKYILPLIIVLTFASCQEEIDNQVYIGFSFTTGPNTAPCTIEFYNYSQNTDQFIWDFGDGTTSNEMEPKHFYESAGNYTVKLTASNGDDVKTSTRILTIGDEVPLVTSPPDSLGLNPFYKKYLDANGIPVISSENVPDEALVKVRNMANYMMKKIPQVRSKMIQYHTRIGIMSKDEVTTDIPEHAFLKSDPNTNWDERSRGLGGTVSIPISTCAEENILCYQADRYQSEDIFIHEFAHSIHLIGIMNVDPTFNTRLTAIYNQSLLAGKWANTYAAGNIEEFWAEGVQDWFNCNTESNPPNGIHNHVNTRNELLSYDLNLYNLIKEYFPDENVQLSCHSY